MNDVRVQLEANAAEFYHQRTIGYPTREQAAPAAFEALRAVLAEADKAEHGAKRWADPLPVPEWVDTVRAAISSALTPKDAQ